MPQRCEPIAIIGTGCRFPGNSTTPSKLWELLREPRDLLVKIPEDRFNSKAFYHEDPNHHGTTDVQESYFLSEDPRKFDAQFFAIQPMESESIDPQQRMLLETVYESISAAGLTLEGLRGSPTAVYVGLMCDDWSGILTRDWDAFPTYTATGMARSIISNRISYFFDWHGPSMTIDTACSSSLVAVHQAIQTLRSGESRVAVAAGANLILSPGMYIAESKLHMLSPSGRCQMWDQAADGYGRGEGIAAVVLKTLSAALEDGDHIECIIRETGINQDGRTTGITMPNNVAQATLIRETYARAGLDLSNVNDRPQFFHAHGTGTPAGDPQEAEAIKNAFFNDGNPDDRKLYVGSIKTVIGHTEGTAGLASLIGASLAVQQGIIPPNMHFKNLSEKVSPFYQHLEVPTVAKSWPVVPHSQPRRASVNSFGFGGSNAHAIIESYERPEAITLVVERPSELPLFTPLTFSAASEQALRDMLKSYSQFLGENKSLNVRDLAWTLQSRRSVLPFKISVTGTTIGDLQSKIESQLTQSDENGTSLGIRSPNTKSSRILGIFTGQGAQWPTMCGELITSSSHVRGIIAKLDRSLASLPKNHRPSWSIKDELLASAETSGLAKAALSQPMCTAVQIVLVDLLRSAGIHLQAAVGHSSGEIGAAYSAGLISAEDAIRIAYYRGLYANLACSPNGQKGSMMAVGTSLEDARSFCELEEFRGRLVVAACNSSASVTLAGDADAVDAAIEIFKDEQKFARKLNVDTAYHSFHMTPCSEPYLESITGCGVKVEEVGSTSWFSSVYPGQRMSGNNLTGNYWVENMTNPVMFSEAVASAVSDQGPFDLVLEIGPHPALKGPCLTSIEGASGVANTPYSGVLSRGKHDVEEFSTALGFVWTHLDSSLVDFNSYEKLVSGIPEAQKLVVDLPTYPWDHKRSYWTESRISGAYRAREEAPHPILGTKCLESSTTQEMHWRNLLRPSEVGWLNGHKLQGQTVFPASGYVAMAIEAMKSLARDRPIKLIEVEKLSISRAITFNDDSSGVETLLSLNFPSSNGDNLEHMMADFKCYSSSQNEKSMSTNATGRIIFHPGDPLESSLPAIPSNQTSMVDVNVDRFYTSLTKLGYNYSGPFRAISAIKRRIDTAVGTLSIVPTSSWEDRLLIHPGMLDTAFQTIFAAFCSPGDNRLWSLHVPTSIERLLINPYFCTPGKAVVLPFQSTVTSIPTVDLQADVELFSETGQETFIEIEGVRLVPFSPPSKENDSTLFSKFVWSVANPDGILTSRNERPTASEMTMANDLERVCYFYLRKLVETITPVEKAQTLWHYQRLLDWASHVVDVVSRGQNPSVSPEYKSDTHEQIAEIIGRYAERIDVRLIHTVGENLPGCIRTRGNILEFMTQDGLLSNFYEEGSGLKFANRWIGRMVKQIAHRYPHMNIFEIGAGTGGATREILNELGSAFSSYTYTDISSAFFETAEERFQRFADRIIFKTFDMEKEVDSQGYVEGSYDMVIGSNVLHATDPLEIALGNARKLLKPGGFLLFLEVTNNEALRNGLPMGGLPGWWVGAENGRPWGPTVSLIQWDAILRKTGFSGVDTTTPETDRLHAFSVFSTQAVDERVNFLRRPLSNPLPMPELFQDNLVIIGGSTLQTSRLVEDMTTHLAPRYNKITNLLSIDLLEMSEIPSGSAVLCVTELDEPIFKSLTSSRLECVKTLFTQARDMLFVTRGCRSDEPYSNMMVGIGRGLRFEYPNVNLQMLDVDKLNDESASMFVSHLLRLQAVNTWKRERPLDDLLWSMEPEISVERGTYFIPRLLVNQEQNDRYNSSRRLITRDLNPQLSNIECVSMKSSYELRDTSARNAWQQPDAVGKISFRVTHSLLRSIKIKSAGYLFLCVGKEVISGENILALSDGRRSLVQVPLEWTIRYPSAIDPQQLLLSVAGNLLAQYITSKIHSGGTLLVHEPYAFLTSALARQAQEDAIKLQFTTSQRGGHIDSSWIYIHNQSPQRALKAALPNDVSLFMDLSTGNEPHEIGGRIAEWYSSIGKTQKRTKLLSDESLVRRGIPSAQIGEVLQAAWAISQRLGFDVGTPGIVKTVLLSELPHQAGFFEPALIVDWTTNAQIKLEPVDSWGIFRPDRTYLLVGLTGDIGQSICHWMVCHGARYVVLTSRNPNVSQEWIQSLESMGAVIKVHSLDITNRDSLHSVYEDICQTLPPIAGVANGAMVLRDMMFQNMDFNSMSIVLKPKVEGSKYLDELFPQDTLDFFILFSSITGVVGNTGQSNYIAANMFMASLARQRKNRGLAGSVIDISSVIGVGYVERSETFDANYFASVGYTNMSEQDLHQLFAEAIVAGQPRSTDSCEIVTGFAPAYSDVEIKAPYRSDLKFGHFILYRLDDQQNSNQQATVPVKVQLSTAKSRDQVYGILKESLNLRLKKILQIAVDGEISETMTLVEQGVDSLVAVEVRSWFLKEVDIDMPVLKVLGGASISDLLEDALNRIPAGLIPEIRSTEPQAPEEAPVQANSKAIIGDDKQHGDVHTLVFTPSSGSSVSPPSSLRADALGESETSISLSDSGLLENPTKLAGYSEVTERMSFGQSRFWFLNHFLRDPTTFNMAISVRLRGNLRVADLERAVRAVGQKHEALRTRFFSAGSHMEEPMQGVLPNSLVHLKQKFITDEQQAAKELDDMRDHVWDLEHWETMKITLLSLSKTTHFLIIGCHHIAMDGLSFQIFFADLEKAYLGQNLSPCPKDCQYRAFSALQHQEYENGKMESDLEFYRKIIPKDPQPLPLFPFALTSSRKVLETYSAHRADFRLDSALTARIKNVSRKHKSTSFHFYLAALQSLIFHVQKDTDDFFIGIADANRTESKFIGTLGFFLNLLPLRFQRDSSKTFGQTIEEARGKAYGALGHSKLPFDVLLNKLDIARSASHTPLFQVFVDYRQGVQERTGFADCQAEGESWHIAKTGYDMSLDIIENAAGDSLLTLKLQKAFYSSEVTNMVLKNYVNLLNLVATNPDIVVGSQSLWQKADIDSAIELGQGPTLKLEWPATLSHVVDTVAQEQGSSLALKDGTSNTLTYSQMAARVNAISQALVASDAVDGVNVAVFQEPTSDWICSLLAIFRVGAVYVPLDLRTALPRLAVIVQTCQIHTIIADAATLGNTSALGAPNAIILDVSTIPESEKETLANRANASSPAVILFTSGSTGTPKGIVITHSSLRNQLEGYSREWNIASAAGLVLQQSAFSFDFSIDQIFSALANGGSLYVVPADKRGDPIEITKLMASEGVTYTSATPSEYLIWTRYGHSHLSLCSKWQYAFAGGEPLTEILTEEIRRLGLSGLRFFNNYGPAEITVASTKIEILYNQMTPGEPIPAGFMLPNYSVYILDDHLKPVPVGFPREIVIGGSGVASGYLDNKELTEVKFIADVFASSNPSFVSNNWNTMYRTGDRGRLRADGALICEGRIDGDTQIKLRGFRIELEEIERALLQVSDGALVSAAVTLRGETDSEFLVGHVVFSREYPAESCDSFLQNLASKLPLPQYMVPSFIVALDSLPLSNHFKLDRSALKSLPLAAPQPDFETTVLSETESILYSVWLNVLPDGPTSAIKADTDFFLVGGNSLLLVKLQALIRESFDVAIRLVDLMNAGTLGGMASAIQDAASTRRIDWEQETMLPKDLLQEKESYGHISNKSRSPSDNLVVLLTGSTGYLGRNILRRLVADPKIAKIHCVAIREHDIPDEQRLSVHSDKIAVQRGDLGLSRLGLSEEEFSALSREVDIIIHSGANRSFWDNYSALRSSNVSPIKELVKMALRSKIPIHFISSGGVLKYHSTNPPTDGCDGYIASKWAAEQYLVNAARELRLPAYIHRPLACDGTSSLSPTEILDELSALAKQMKLRPSFTGVQGSIDLIPTDILLEDLFTALFSTNPTIPPLIVQHKSHVRVDMGLFAHRVAADVEMQSFRDIPALEWVGEAKKMGFNYVIASQDISMVGDQGSASGLISKR